MDKTGVAFTVLLIALAAIVVSVLLIDVQRRAPDTGDGGLVPAPAAVPVD